MEESKRILLSSNINTESLSVPSVQSSENGQYYVTVANESGEAVAAFSLLI